MHFLRPDIEHRQFTRTAIKTKYIIINDQLAFLYDEAWLGTVHRRGRAQNTGQN